MSHRRIALAAVCLIGCQRAPDVDIASTPAPAPTAEPEPEPEPTKPKPAELLNMDAQGVELHPLYQGCAHAFNVEVVGGEVFVAYVTEGVGRIDRIGPRGEVVEAIDLDPGIASRATYASRFGLPKPKGKIPRSSASSKKLDLPHAEQPMGDLDGPEGFTADDWFVIADFNVYNTAWQTRIARYRMGRWTKLRDIYGDWAMMFTWQGRVMTYGEDRAPGRAPYFDWADANGALPDFEAVLPAASEALGRDVDSWEYAGGILVVSWDSSPKGPLAALVAYDPDRNGDSGEAVGSWLMIWSSPDATPRIEQISERVLEEHKAEVRVDGERIFVEIGDADEREWIDGELVAIADRPASCPFEDAPDVSVPGEWFSKDDCLAMASDDGWHSEPLPPGHDGWLGNVGGQLWITLEDGTVWSREGPKQWAKHPIVGAREQAPDWTTGTVVGAGDVWLVSTYDESDRHERSYDPLVRTWQSADVFTTRPVDAPNPCRTGLGKGGR